MKTFTKSVKIASFGVGVDSVAGILLETPEKYDEIIFADTGSEKPETYAYLDYITKTIGWKVTVLKAKYGNIYDYYYNKKRYPHRFARDCTGKFKIDVMNKYLRTKYGKDTMFLKDVFIDYSEFHRMKKEKYLYEKLNYPLVEKKINRDECIKIIESHGLLVPVKSGCFFCPFTPPETWMKLKEKHPDLFQKALQMEKNSTMRKKRDFPLISYKGKETMSLFECGCFSG